METNSLPAASGVVHGAPVPVITVERKLSMTYTLRNNTTVEHRKFDRLPEWDPMNNNFPMRRLVSPTIAPRSYTWPVGQNMSSQLFLDQGTEGACVGFTYAHELAARPVVVPRITNEHGRSFYRGAQENDEWAGSDYEGTSGLGGAKYLTQLGYYKSYTWSRNADEVALVVSRKGPVPLFLNWYEGMFDTSEAGWIFPSRQLLGGHAILCKGYSVSKRCFILHNSWGKSWGMNGTALLKHDDLQRLLDENGEACLPLRKPYQEEIVW
jgi:hypothetical protein